MINRGLGNALGGRFYEFLLFLPRFFLILPFKTIEKDYIPLISPFFQNFTHISPTGGSGLLTRILILWLSNSFSQTYMTNNPRDDQIIWTLGLDVLYIKRVSFRRKSINEYFTILLCNHLIRRGKQNHRYICCWVESVHISTRQVLNVHRLFLWLSSTFTASLRG